MTREELIDAYRELLYKNEEYDVWEDEIEPKLDDMTDTEIYKAYENDMNWYEYRKTMIQA